MWIPAGGGYLATAKALLASWVRAAEEGLTEEGPSRGKRGGTHPIGRWPSTVPAVTILIGALIMFAYPPTENVFRQIVRETAARQAARRAGAPLGTSARPAAGEAT